MVFDWDKERAAMLERQHIRCPKCNRVEDDSCELGEADLITYWGEEGPVAWHCPNCETVLLVNEIVTREYEIKEVVTSYFAVQYTDEEGNTWLSNPDMRNTKREDCQGEMYTMMQLWKGQPSKWWDKVREVKIIEIEVGAHL